MHRFANPTRFRRLSAVIRPPAALLAVGLFGWGLWLALFGSPPDFRQGETVRIMYVHVPAAWMATMVYASMAVAAVAAYVWRHPVADLYIKAAAPLGAAFTGLCLVSGSLWGAPMWGAWWVWDGRLTSVLILFFVYLGYIALSGAFDDEQRGLAAGRVLVLVGAINLPIIKFSVDWWNTLHQPASISRLDAPAIHPSMLLPLLAMAAGFTLFFVAVALVRMRTGLIERRLAVLDQARAATGNN
jgi:heme exporter protein C